MTRSYLAGVARRATPGRAALLPPVTPWGAEARQIVDRPDAAHVLAPAPAPEAVSPDAIAPARRPGRRSVTAKSNVGRPASPELSAVPEPVSFPSAPVEPPTSRPAPTEPEPMETTASVSPESGRVANVTASAMPVQKRTKEQRVEAHPLEPLAAPESTERRANPRPPVPPVRIESIEVVVERPQASASPASRAERTRTPMAAPAPPAALARGFSSLIGLRQG